MLTLKEAQVAEQPFKFDPDKKPSVKTVYYIARLFCDVAGVEFPKTQGEASELIAKLKATLEDDS